MNPLYLVIGFIFGSMLGGSGNQIELSDEEKKSLIKTIFVIAVIMLVVTLYLFIDFRMFMHQHNKKLAALNHQSEQLVKAKSCLGAYDCHQCAVENDVVELAYELEVCR